MYHNITAVILAGGAGKRLNGIVKGRIIIDGKEIMLRILEVLGGLFEDIIIITNDCDEYKDYKKYNIFSDILPGKGPLGGIHTGLTVALNEAVFIFAGDMPYLHKDLIIKMIDSFNNSDYGIIIPQIGNNIEPLHGIYRKSNIEILENYLENENDNSVRGFLKKADHHFIQFGKSEKTALAFTNINTPDDVLISFKNHKSDF